MRAYMEDDHAGFPRTRGDRPYHRDWQRKTRAVPPHTRG